MSIKKKAIKVGNKFILDAASESFEDLVVKAINNIEAHLKLPLTNFSDAFKNRRN